jgi:hypothetical protein
MGSLTHIDATVVDGELKLDDRLDLPNESRVEVKIRPLPSSGAAQIEQPLSAWESLKQSLRKHPINSGGLKFTREELYEGR